MPRDNSTSISGDGLACGESLFMLDLLGDSFAGRLVHAAARSAWRLTGPSKLLGLSKLLDDAMGDLWTLRARPRLRNRKYSIVGVGHS
jgi:hypothetical protein